MTKAQLIDKYEAEICQLKRDNRNVYVGETYSLHQSDGELYVEHPNGTLVFDIINLHRDLFSWVSMVRTGHEEHQIYLQERLVDSIKECV
jgi:hypothetical protein